MVCVSSQLFLARAPTHSSDFQDSPWEAKALVLVESMSSPEHCVAGCEELLRSVCLPWSKAVERLAQHCRELDAPNRAELQSLYSLLQLKTMLQETYGILDFNFSDRNTGYVSASFPQYPTHLILPSLLPSPLPLPLLPSSLPPPSPAVHSKDVKPTTSRSSL